MPVASGHYLDVAASNRSTAEDRNSRPTIPAAPTPLGAGDHGSSSRQSDSCAAQGPGSDRHSAVIVTRRYLAEMLDGRACCPICLEPRESSPRGRLTCDCSFVAL